MIKKNPIWHLARPRGSRVWGYPVYREEGEVESENGLIIPQTAVARQVLYAIEVVRVGPNVDDVKEGDTCTLDGEGHGEVISITDDSGEIYNIFQIHEKYLALVIGES